MTVFEDSLKADTATIIGDFQQTISVKIPATIYNASGEGYNTWYTIYSAYADLQPLNKNWSLANKEAGQVVTTDHVVYCYYDTAGVAMSIKEGYKIVDASGNEYTVYRVKDYGEHTELYLIRCDEADINATSWAVLGSSANEGDGMSPQAGTFDTATAQDKTFCYLSTAGATTAPLYYLGG